MEKAGVRPAAAEAYWPVLTSKARQSLEPSSSVPPRSRECPLRLSRTEFHLWRPAEPPPQYIESPFNRKKHRAPTMTEKATVTAAVKAPPTYQSQPRLAPEGTRQARCKHALMAYAIAVQGHQSFAMRSTSGLQMQGLLGSETRWGSYQ